MYTIGEFSVITGISRKTLRYYDEIKLLKPAEINTDNNYRLYDKYQIKNVRRILNLKVFGLSLQEIKQLMADDSEDILKGILNMRIESINRHINMLNEQINSIKKYQSEKYVDEDNAEFIITDGILTSGYILQMALAEDENYHSQIHKFYDYATEHDYRIISSHYFKKSIANENDDTYIFAYVDGIKDYGLAIKIKDTKTIEISGIGLIHKSSAYEYLISYAREHKIEIAEIIEEAKMNDGRLGFNIKGLCR